MGKKREQGIKSCQGAKPRSIPEHKGENRRLT